MAAGLFARGDSVKGGTPPLPTLDEFFGDQAESRTLFDALLGRINSIGQADYKVTKSQIAFRRKRQFAWVWIPGKYLRGKTAPLVLSISFPARDPSPRWKDIVEPAPGRFMHHLEFNDLSDIDYEVTRWLRSAWEQADT
jgi:hypothetical protein